MQYLWTFSLLLSVATAKSKSNSVRVDNKNINIIVNADAKEIAKELWKIIEMHVKNDGNPFTPVPEVQENTVKEIEEVIKQVAEPSRRAGPMTDSELAEHFERIVRRSISVTGISPSSDSDPMKNVNDIVTEMVLVARKYLDRSGAKIIPREDEFTSEKLVLIRPDSATPSLILHQIIRSLESIEDSLKNCVVPKKRVTEDFSANFGPVVYKELIPSKLTEIHSGVSAELLRDDIGELLRNHRGKRREQEYSNANINENHFYRRNTNTNVNDNRFPRPGLNGAVKSIGDMDAANFYGVGKNCKNTNTSPSPMDHILSRQQGPGSIFRAPPLPLLFDPRLQIPRSEKGSSFQRNQNINSNSNIFGSSPDINRYRSKLRRQRDGEYNHLLPTMIEDPAGFVPSLPAAGNTNINHNVNGMINPTENVNDYLVSAEDVRKRRRNQRLVALLKAAKSRRALPQGTTNLNVNRNSFGGFKKRPAAISAEDGDDYDMWSEPEDIGLGHEYDDDDDDDDDDDEYYNQGQRRDRVGIDQSSEDRIGSGIVNANSNTNVFRRNLNSNVNTNKNYFRRTEG